MSPIYSSLLPDKPKTPPKDTARNFNYVQTLILCVLDNKELKEEAILRKLIDFDRRWEKSSIVKRLYQMKKMGLLQIEERVEVDLNSARKLKYWRLSSRGRLVLNEYKTSFTWSSLTLT